MSELPPLEIVIGVEEAADSTAAEALLDKVFGPGRRKRTVYSFRDGITPLRELCFAAHGSGETRDSLVGLLRFWPARLPDGRIAALFGPLAVPPELHGRGIGRRLIRHSLAEVARQGFGGVLIVGAPDYYAPFGFGENAVRGLHLPGPAAPLTFMGLDMPGHEGFLARTPGLVTPLRSNTA